MTKRRLGQHFLFDPTILRRIIQSAKVSENDTVVEIGPGPGRLTRLLSEQVKKVIAIELDHALVEKLKGEFFGIGSVEIIQGDALKFFYEGIGNFKVVGNIPYYITTPLIFRLLKAKAALQSMTLTMQKEVAERIVATPGTKDYGVLSIMAQYHTLPELKFIIQKESFRPMPRVDSAVVHMTVFSVPSVPVMNEKFFFSIVRTAFAQRRKMLGNSLKPFGKHIKEILADAGIDPVRRPETLSINEFVKLSDILSEKRI
ncbi:MAG: ribosomal RNA small subunit methyltransferase A [Nitrospiraceae bacterium]|nr:MAG: ribosomal RNA small subunit methyltransferase A [Nitrospiraceae bacterium]